MRFQIGGPVVVLIAVNIYSTSISSVKGDAFAKPYKWWNPKTWCFFYQCEACTNKYVTPNFTKLNIELNERVYGQHLMIDVVPKAIRAHVENTSPKKSLVLSFHGRTGGGKNFVSQIIAESLFRRGMDSKYVHLFIPELHFPHKEKITIYKDQLRNWIRGNISSCPSQLFIFDEMQSLLPELIDVIKPFIDYHNHRIDGVDYRNAIYIFLSSTSGEEIMDVALKAFKDGHDRESMTLKDFEGVIRSSSYSHQGTGLWHSKLIKHHLVSHFVPFLPLERQHVRRCIQHEMKDRGWGQCTETEDEVLDYLNFGPEGYPIYASKGCKNIHEKLNLVKY